MDERLKNFLLFKVYATDAEMEEMAPAIAVIGIVIVVLALIFYFAAPSSVPQQPKSQPVNIVVEKPE